MAFDEQQGSIMFGSAAALLHVTRLSLSLVFVVAGFVPPAAAQSPSIGVRLAAVLSDIWGPFLFLIASIALVTGLWLFVRGMVRLKDGGGDDSRGYKGTLSEGMQIGRAHV